MQIVPLSQKISETEMKQNLYPLDQQQLEGYPGLHEEN